MANKQPKTVHSKNRGFSPELKLFSTIAAIITLTVLSFGTFVALQDLNSKAADESSLGNDTEVNLSSRESPYFKISFVTQQSIGLIANNENAETEADRSSSAFL